MQATAGQKPAYMLLADNKSDEIVPEEQEAGRTILHKGLAVETNKESIIMIHHRMTWISVMKMS